MATGGDVRASYIAGLRALADLLDDHPDLPTPLQGGSRGAEFQVSVRSRAALAAVAAAFPPMVDTGPHEDFYAGRVTLTWDLAPPTVPLHLYVVVWLPTGDLPNDLPNDLPDSRVDVIALAREAANTAGGA